VLSPFIPANQETSMALMFPRLARNFAKNGYYPTDEPTLERALNALMPSDPAFNGPMCILDPCAGEGVAIAEAAHDLSSKTLIPFITHGGYGLGDSRTVLAQLASKAQLRQEFSMEADQERRTMEQVNRWLGK